MIANSQFDCGLRAIGLFMGMSTKDRCDNIDRDMLQLEAQNKEVYSVTSIICSMQKEMQKDLWEYLVNKHGFKQITPWHPAKTLIDPGKADEIALFHKPMTFTPPVRNTVNTYF